MTWMEDGRTVGEELRDFLCACRADLAYWLGRGDDRCFPTVKDYFICWARDGERWLWRRLRVRTRFGTFGIGRILSGKYSWWPHVSGTPRLGSFAVWRFAVTWGRSRWLDRHQEPKP